VHVAGVPRESPRRDPGHASTSLLAMIQDRHRHMTPGDLERAEEALDRYLTGPAQRRRRQRETREP
jgi:hypothetical protein